MSAPRRDRDGAGRPLNARPRDALGRPLPYGSPAGHEDLDPALLAAGPAELLALAQRLLDGGRPFQAHEVLEVGWKRAPRPERPLWRGLAQLAVGVTHTARGNAAGAEALYTRAARELARWDPAEAPHGIDVSGLAEAAHRLAKGEQSPVILLRPTPR